MQRAHLPFMLQAVLAALLFGASAPLSKLLLGEIAPITLAAFLYLGAALGVFTFQTVFHTNPTSKQAEAGLARPDLIWLLGAVLSGGIGAPILLLVSLQQTPAATASLLLNFEGVATTLIAALVFKEALSRRAVWAVLCVTLASVLLSWDGSGQWGLSLGALGILGASILWGIENNLTRNISAKNPLTIVLIKGIGAGSVSFILSLLVGNPLPSFPVILGALVLGSLSYGCSIVLYIRALRGIGTTRTSALFSTSPLAGVAISFLILREAPPTIFFVALPLMAFAMYLLMNENHGHLHWHEETTHEHRHRHDDGHHAHPHEGAFDPQAAHSHFHTHKATQHEHPHLPDIEHRHSH